MSEDTTLEVARIQFSIFRKIGIEERANMAIELSDGLRSTIESGVRLDSPILKEYNCTYENNSRHKYIYSCSP